jgi:Putative peptidoglycan binding domain
MRRSAAAALGALALVAGGASAAAAQSPFEGDSMWIWVVERSSGGDPAAIVRQARRHGIETVVVKGADSLTRWWQFSPDFVSRLKAGGLRVCAYQFIYGRYPRGEAVVAAQLASAGADCLMIDAEGHYEGRYAQAQRYITELRARVGGDYPVGLTSFPYVHYHPAFPYSVFLGPGGAQFNVPQMYWRAIGTTVDRVFSTTYGYNQVYGRPILPLGQVWQHPPAAQILRFRQLARAYGATGVSWWDWQEAGGSDWRAVGAPFAELSSVFPTTRYPALGRGARGDLVVWAQQHLRAAGAPVPVDGVFGPRTEGAVRAFQRAAGLPAGGAIEARTWQALLRLAPARTSWRANGARAAALGGRSGPPSARLPPRRNELGRRSTGWRGPQIKRLLGSPLVATTP